MAHLTIKFNGEFSSGRESGSLCNRFIVRACHVAYTPTRSLIYRARSLGGDGKGVKKKAADSENFRAHEQGAGAAEGVANANFITFRRRALLLLFLAGHQKEDSQRLSVIACLPSAPALYIQKLNSHVGNRQNKQCKRERSNK